MRLRFMGLITVLGLMGGLSALPTQAQTPDVPLPAKPAEKTPGKTPEKPGENPTNQSLDKPVVVPTTSPSPNQTKRVTVYDRYMQAGYEATKKRDDQTALLYFKRALDERPSDSYATQAIRNVESYLKQSPSSTTITNPSTPTSPPGKPSNQPAPTNKPASTGKPPTTKPPTTKPPTTKPPATKPPTTKPPTTKPPATKPPATKPPSTTKSATPQASPHSQQPANTHLPNPPQSTASAGTARPSASSLPSVAVSSQPPPASITEQQALELVNRWLQAKADIFAPPFDQQQVLNLTSGELLASLLKPEGVLAWLKTNRAYYRYGAQKIDSLERFVATRSRVTMELKVTEERTLYLNGVIAPEQTDFAARKIRFTLELVDGNWKIADYKTTDGSLLERSQFQGNANSTNR